MADLKKELGSAIELYKIFSEGLVFSDPDFVYQLPELREDVFALMSGGAKGDSIDMKRLEETDAYVLSHLDGLPQDYNEDDPSQPPEKWWWHLRAIKEGRLQAFPSRPINNLS